VVGEKLENRIGHRDYAAARLCDMINHAEKVLLFKNSFLYILNRVASRWKQLLKRMSRNVIRTSYVVNVRQFRYSNRKSWFKEITNFRKM